MSGIASVALAFWASFFPPANVQAGRTLLWISAVVCFTISSYRLWSRERKAFLTLRANQTKLVFEIDTNVRSRVQIIHDESMFKRPDIEPVKRDHYVIRANLSLRLVNHDTQNPVNLWGMKLSLIRRNRGREKEIPVESSILTEVLEEGQGRVHFSDGLTVGAGRRETRYSSYNFELDLAAEYGKKLDRYYFLRLIMEAAGQPPYPVDLDVDWKQAIAGGSFISLRNPH